MTYESAISVVSNMYTLTIIVTLCTISAVLAAPAGNTRIIGGIEADIGDIPYIVSVRAMGKAGCGGAILSETYVVTAAHCIYTWVNHPQGLSIQYGVVEVSPKGPNRIRVKRVVVHEQFDIDSPGIINDIAILELVDKIQFGPTVQPAKLPTQSEEIKDLSVATIAGWGLISNNGTQTTHLMSTVVLTFSNEYCYSLDNRYNSTVHICGGLIDGGIGQCTGDSGGPVIVNSKLFGVISWSEKPCASPNNPGIFTKVSTYRTWIKETTGI